MAQDWKTVRSRRALLAVSRIMGSSRICVSCCGARGRTCCCLVGQNKAERKRALDTDLQEPVELSHRSSKVKAQPKRHCLLLQGRQSLVEL